MRSITLHFLDVVSISFDMIHAKYMFRFYNRQRTKFKTYNYFNNDLDDLTCYDNTRNL